MEQPGIRDDLNESVKDKKNKYFYNITKRVIDIVFSMLGIIFLSPVFIVTIIAIKLDSNGPAFFAQDRVGKGKKVFSMYKFRSMVINAEELKEKLIKQNEMDGPMFKIKKDPRITKVGEIIRRTSIDELPQLFNILKGEMSLVGPRPSLPKEVVQFEPWMIKRLDVKPGLTCYWQISGRNDIKFNEWMKLDCKYVNDRNTLLDLKLIFKTVLLLFGDEHAR